MESFSVLHHSVCFVSYIKGFSGNTKKSSRVARGQINYSKILWWLHVMCGVSKHVVSSGLSVSPPSHHHHHWSSWIPKKKIKRNYDGISWGSLLIVRLGYSEDFYVMSFQVSETLRISWICSLCSRYSSSSWFLLAFSTCCWNWFCKKKNCFIFKLLSLQLNIFNISYV